MNKEDKLSDKYILSRLCGSCGKAETYHGKEERWIEVGYVKVCKPNE